MTEQTMQNKILTTFINEIASTKDFSVDEAEKIRISLSSGKPIDQVVEDLRKVIGDVDNEDS